MVPYWNGQKWPIQSQGKGGNGSGETTYGLSLLVGGLDKAGRALAAVLAITQSVIIDAVGASKVVQAGVAFATIAGACVQSTG